MANIVTIGIVQDTASDDLEANVTKAVARVRDAAAKGAQIICLQELFNAPYFCKSVKPERFDIAQATDGPIVHTFQALAKELAVVIVVPYYEKEAAGLYRNSATVIDADGSVLGTYRKMHIPHDPLFEEKYYFAPGDVTGDQRTDTHPGYNGFRVWRTKYADIGVLICWDQWYPEAARLMALAGADLLIYPTAIGWNLDDPEAERERQLNAWITVQRGHAVANGLPVIACNRIGHEEDPSRQSGGIRFWGNSFAVGPQGEYLTHLDAVEEKVELVEIDKTRSEDVRRIWPFLRDRRIESYGDLTRRYVD